LSSLEVRLDRFRKAFPKRGKEAHLLQRRHTGQLVEVAEEARRGRAASDASPFAKTADLEFAIADDGRCMRCEMAPDLPAVELPDPERINA
jgi:hypothetical protein